ncbi:MAG: hypothetical protein AAGI68_06565 [Planctomycetota bacterium]
MVNLPRPHAASLIEHHATDAGVELAYSEKSMQNPVAWVALAAFLVIWLIGIIFPVTSMVGSAGTLAAPALIWLAAWGGVGIFFLYNLVRQRIVGRAQRLRFEDDRIVFLPKARLPRSAPRPTAINRHPRQQPILHKRMARGPLRVSALDRQDLDAVEPNSGGGITLKTRSGDIHLAKTLHPADIDYLLDVVNTWHDA